MPKLDDQQPRLAARPQASPDEVDPRDFGVHAYDTRDVMGDGGQVRVLCASRRTGRAAHLIRRAGFRVHSWTPALTVVSRAEVEMACSAPGVVMWRSHDPEISEQWFWMPH